MLHSTGNIPLIKSGPKYIRRYGILSSQEYFDAIAMVKLHFGALFCCLDAARFSNFLIKQDTLEVNNLLLNFFFYIGFSDRNKF